jgi:hypothetical protein
LRRPHVGESATIVDHPLMPTLTGKRCTVIERPADFGLVDPETALGYQSVWVRMEGNSQVEYAVPLKHLLFEDLEAEE